MEGNVNSDDGVGIREGGLLRQVRAPGAVQHIGASGLRRDVAPHARARRRVRLASRRRRAARTTDHGLIDYP
jgi:hypothetical protein